MVCLAYIMPTLTMEEDNSELVGDQLTNFDESPIYILPAELLEMILLKVFFDESACDGCQNIYEALDYIKQKLPDISKNFRFVCKKFNSANNSIISMSSSKDKLKVFYRSLLIEKYLHLVDDSNLMNKEIKNFLITGNDNGIICKIIDPCSFDFSKKTGFQEHNLTQIISLLLFYGANVNSKDEYGNSALHSAMFRYKDDTEDSFAIKEVFKLLLIKGADVNIQDDNGDTVLHLTLFIQSCASKLGIVKILLDHNVDISIPNNNGDTVKASVERNQYREFKELLDV